MALLNDEFGAGGACPLTSANMRLRLDQHVRELRAPLADALDAPTLALLRSGANSNRAGWLEATDLENAKLRVATSYDAGRYAGYSMSPIVSFFDSFAPTPMCSLSPSLSLLLLLFSFSFLKGTDWVV